LAALSVGRSLSIVFLAALYAIAPLFLLDGPRNADNHYVQTLRLRQQRAGKTVELDRVRFSVTAEGGTIRTRFGETLLATGMSLRHPALVSLRGVFRERNRIEVGEFHRHSPLYRDLASYAGLAALALVWSANLLQRRRSFRDGGVVGDG
jgi:hypothetical protein